MEKKEDEGCSLNPATGWCDKCGCKIESCEDDGTFMCPELSDVPEDFQWKELNFNE